MSDIRLVISSIDSDKIILKTEHAESTTQMLEGYGKVAKFFRAIIEHISRVLCCCCPMQPLLKVSLKDKAVYLHPDQIKDCLKTFKIILPATTRICQTNLDQFILMNIPKNGNEQEAETEGSEIETNASKPVDSETSKQRIRVNIKRNAPKTKVPEEVVENYLLDNLGYERCDDPNESDVVFYLYGFSQRLTDPAI